MMADNDTGGIPLGLGPQVHEADAVSAYPEGIESQVAQARIAFYHGFLAGFDFAMETVREALEAAEESATERTVTEVTVTAENVRTFQIIEKGPCQ